MNGEERVRLHITPFNPSLLERYIPESLRPQATDISFHSVETFPEKGFGYVELPAMEAQKLKKKLNGSVLKGSKVKIEEARPHKKRKSEDVVAEDVEEDKVVRKKAKKEKKTKPKDGEKVLPGHELEESRHIKRGWVEDKSKSKKASKDGEKSGIESRKMRFKTTLPENKSSLEESKKSKSKDKEAKDKKKTSKKEIVVKEFEKSKKPQDGGAKSRKSELKYEEGQGWVNENGKTVESEPPNKKRRREKAAAEEVLKKEKKSKKVTPEPPADPIVAEAPDLESEPEDEEIEIAHAGLPIREEWSGDEDSVSSSSESSESSPSPDPSSREADSDAELDEQLARAKSNTVSNKNTPGPDATLGGTPEISQPVGEPKEIHPLEALFKRSTSATEDITKPKPAPIDTSFSFFNSGADNEDGELGITAELKVPQTPRTKEELEWRSIRSAAPTPDTAAIGKSFDYSFSNEDEEMQDAPESPVRAKAATENGEKEESEFRKWFYENRGDLNRSWKKRRREERKVVRQRENRRLNRRV